MAAILFSPTTNCSKIQSFLLNPQTPTPFFSNSFSLLSLSSLPGRKHQLNFQYLSCNAAAAPKQHQSGPVKKRSPPPSSSAAPTNRQRKKKGFNGPADFQIGNDENDEFPRRNKGFGGGGGEFSRKDKGFGGGDDFRNGNDGGFPRRNKGFGGGDEFPRKNKGVGGGDDFRKGNDGEFPRKNKGFGGSDEFPRKNKGFGGGDEFQIRNDDEIPRKNKGFGGGGRGGVTGVVDDLDIQDDFEIQGTEFRPPSNPKSKSKPKPKMKKKKATGSSSRSSQSRGSNLEEDSDWDDEQPLEGPIALPKPPAGFVLDDQGRVVLVSNKRLITIVDPTGNAPLECVIRRVFRSSKGDECMLLCPVDMPVQIMKSTNFEGWAAVSDEEAEGLLPTVAFTLAKIHMHFVPSGFCYTARGGFCYSEDAIFDINSDTGENATGRTTEAVEITCFNKDGSHYMLYTPADPLLFVAVKDQNGQLQIAEDDLLEDPAVVSAIDEETEFTALVEEEEALLASLLGEEILP